MLINMTKTLEFNDRHIFNKPKPSNLSFILVGNFYGYYADYSLKCFLFGFGNHED